VEKALASPPLNSLGVHGLELGDFTIIKQRTIQSLIQMYYNHLHFQRQYSKAAILTGESRRGLYCTLLNVLSIKVSANFTETYQSSARGKLVSPHLITTFSLAATEAIN